MSVPLLRLLTLVAAAVPIALAACTPEPPSSFPCNDDEDCATGRGFACDLSTSRCAFVGEPDAGLQDAGHYDAGLADGGVDDAGLGDSGFGDAGADGGLDDGRDDAGLGDGGFGDAGGDDGGLDNGRDDGGLADGGLNDGGPPCLCSAPLVCAEDSTTCIEPSCGDGVVSEGEECDDANFESGDGCVSCEKTPDWRCERQPSVCALGAAIRNVSGNDAELQGAIDDVAGVASLTHVFVDGSSFEWRPNQAGISISSGDVTLVGYNDAVLSPTNGGPVITLSDGAKLTLIGVHLRQESAGDPGAGAVATDTGTVLRIVDSIVGPTSAHGVAVTSGARLELIRSHVRAADVDGIHLDTSSYRIENSIITGCGGRGLYTNATPAAESVVRFSTFSGSGGGGVFCNANDTPLDSIVSWGNGGSDVSMDKCAPSYSNIGGIEAAGSNISAQPLFVGSQDFRLQPGSPGIDQGNPAAFPERDVDARLRPAGSGPDMGAHEVWP